MSKFVREFLIPSLNSERFGNLLKWLDRERSIFQLCWCHKAVSDWSEVKAQVFVEWDKMKGHYQPDEKQYFTKSKQRFRAMLYKLSVEGQIKEVKSAMNSKKVYCITGLKKLRKKRPSSNADSVTFSTDDVSFVNNERPSDDANGDEMNEFCNVNNNIDDLDDTDYSQCLNDNLATKHKTVPREENQNSIQIPVTCRPTSVDPEPSSYEESYSSSSSPEYFVNNEDFDETDLVLSYEYFRALNDYYKHRMQNLDSSKSATSTLKIENVEKNRDDC